MAEVKWIKVVTELFDDDKIILIQSMKQGDSILLIWIQLLCLAGKQNNRGRFELNGIPCSVAMLATLFRRPVGLVRTAIDTFLTFGLLTQENGVFVVTNWSKHQSLDSLERSKEQSRKRVENYRSRQQVQSDCNVTSNANVTLSNVTSNVTRNGDVTQCNVTSNGDVTQCNADRIRIRIRDRDIDKELYKEIPKKGETDLVQDELARDSNVDENEDENRDTPPKKPSRLEVEFSEIWELYPRREGRKPALSAYVRSRRSGTTFEEVRSGVERFAASVQRKRTEPQYIPLGSTWFQQARWTDEEVDDGNGRDSEQDTKPKFMFGSFV